MQYADPYVTWKTWAADNADQDEAAKLAALREYIVQTAKSWVNSCTYDAAWANKKLAALGITERIDAVNPYTLEVSASGTIAVNVYAHDRAEAVAKFHETVAANANRLTYVKGATIQGDPVFVSGPEDVATVVDPDAPTTVDATLIKLREVILLGHLAGPKVCEEEANNVLDTFGLAHIPPRRQYVVTRPVTAVMRTAVEAYDEASAARVAGWRWENGRAGHVVVDAVVDGVPSVDEAEMVGAPE